MKSLPRAVRARSTTMEGVDVFSVQDAHALIQLIGYLKFTGSRDGMVLFRGHSRFHPRVVPGAYRGHGKVGSERLNQKIREHLDLLFGGPCTCASRDGSPCAERSSDRSRRSPLVLGTGRAVAEPLLQHYGLRTRWVDLVDNVWVALWFACHVQVSEGRFGYHERRSVAQEGPGSKAYISVMDTGKLIPSGVRGLWGGDSGIQVVDLRRAASSAYLRPHAQHGLLLSCLRGSVDDRIERISGCLVGVIEIPLGDALNWLGTGLMTSAFVLFPSAVVDEGYRRLLQGPAPPSVLGDLTLYGPGR